MKTEKSCDNCIYSIPDWTNVCNSDHYCSNEESEEYGYNAEYLNGCDEWKSIENLGNNGSICTKTGSNDEDRTTDDTINRQAAIDALRYAQHRFIVADEAGGMGTVKWSEDVIYFAAAERVLNDLPPAQPPVLTCDGCRHVGTYDTDFPCSVCIRRKKDYYEQE